MNFNIEQPSKKSGNSFESNSSEFEKVTTRLEKTKKYNFSKH